MKLQANENSYKFMELHVSSENCMGMEAYVTACKRI